MSTKRIPLTLVVACSPTNGIGKQGGLPWRLQREMAYFRHVTSRLPRGAVPGSQNAVLMGRHTWLSIPPKFRPLPNRFNIVLSKSQDAASLGITEGAHHCRTLDQAATLLHQHSIARVFLIGGAELYSSFLHHPDQGGFLLDRLLITRIVQPDFDCDTFLPSCLPGSQPTTPTADQTSPRTWRQATPAEVLEWLPQGSDEEPLSAALQALLNSGPEGLHQVEGDVSYELQMWV